MIPLTFDDAFERVKQLVSTFKDNEGRYLSPGYSEAQARLDFIDKLWIALGWDNSSIKCSTQRSNSPPRDKNFTLDHQNRRPGL